VLLNLLESIYYKSLSSYASFKSFGNTYFITFIKEYTYFQDMKNKKTKILAIGDIHGDTGLVKKLAERAKKESVDLIILAGDLTMAEQSIENIVGPLIKTKKQVLLIPGNHESAATIDFLSKMYGAKNLHGYGMKIGDLGIFGAGTANMGPHSIGESGIAELLKKAHKEIKDTKKKVMVTHIHHRGSRSEMFGFKGSKAVRKALEVPE